MAVNLLEAVQQGMPPRFADRAAGLLGESGATTGSALGSLLPLLVAALAHKGTSPGGAQAVMSMLDNPAVNTALPSNVDAMFGDGGAQASSLVAGGSPLAASLLGDKVDALAGTLSSLSGMRTPQSVASLIALVTPLVLAFVKRAVAAENLSASGLASLLGAQGSFLQGALDGRLTSALGFASPAAMLPTATAGDAMRAPPLGPPPAPGYATAPFAAETSSWIGRWWPWIVAAIVVLFLLSRCMGGDKPAGEAIAPPPAPPSAPASATATQALPPNAAPTPAPVAGDVAVPSALPAKVYFDAGKSTLSDAGKATVAAIAGLVKQDAGKVDITGYADSTGDPAQNAEIAKNRAMAVRDALQADGVAEASINMKPPASVTGTGGDAEARRVEVSKAQ